MAPFASRGPDLASFIILLISVADLIAETKSLTHVEMIH